jgi:hypothetical protein
MNYQSICAALEIPFNNAFKALSPSVKIFFDNITPVSPDPPDEYIRINITFGLVTESTLDCSLDRARGAIIARIYTRKNAGGLRSRQLASVAKSVFDGLASTKKTTNGVFVRLQDMAGPTFSVNEKQPHFMARIEATWHATQIS